MKTAIGVGLTTDENWDEFSDYVLEAERMGVDSVWSAEAWGHDGATPLAYLAAKTSRIKLGSGILQTVGRTPANLAMTAMTLQSMSGGRFLLGLGVSGPQVVEGWHGVRYTRPIRRLRETIDVVRLLSQRREVAVRGRDHPPAAAGRRGQGDPLPREAAAEHPGLPRDAQPELARADGRGRGRLARHVVHAGARGRLLRAHPARRAEGRALDGRDRPRRRRRRRRSPTTSTSCSRATGRGSPSRSARWARSSTTSTTPPSAAPATTRTRSPSRTAGSKATARARPRWCPTSW